jgi:Na+/H+-dicarboxylate symporter
MKMVLVLMEIAPIGVFALLAKVFATEGFGAITPLARYFSVVMLGYLLHVSLTYPAIIRFIAGLSPLRFFKKMKEVLAFAFSTASSGATIPVTLRTVEEKMGVDNSVAAFTIPLGATINMDGTAIMQGVATGFIAQAYGIDLAFGDYLMVILTATLASIGTAAVPSAGLITLAMVLRQVNLPVEGIALIIGVDRLLDMMRTTINVAGDAAVTLTVAKSEGRFDRNVFAADENGPPPAIKAQPE